MTARRLAASPSGRRTVSTAQPAVASDDANAAPTAASAPGSVTTTARRASSREGPSSTPDSQCRRRSAGSGRSGSARREGRAIGDRRRRGPPARCRRGRRPGRPPGHRSAAARSRRRTRSRRARRSRMRADRVAALDERADVRRSPQALGEDLRSAVEPDRRSAPVQPPTVAWIDDGPATGRDDAAERPDPGPPDPASATAARSIDRKAGSPSSAKISGIERPASRSIRSSRSMNSAWWRCARRRPTTLLPLPGRPTRTRSIEAA